MLIISSVIFSKASFFSNLTKLLFLLEIELTFVINGIYLGEEYISILETAVSDGWIDKFSNKGKRGGYALFARDFDESEVRFLVDAKFSSKSISGPQAKKLTKKLSSFLSKHKRKNYEYLNKSDEINRTENKQVFFNIDVIKF